MFKILRNKKGVTLIELLAVVVILGIIAAIAVPTIGGLINRQEQRAAEATYDAIVEAAKLYADDGIANNNVFLLSVLEPDWIDLKDNTFGFDDGEALAANLVVVTVNGNVVTFSSGTVAAPVAESEFWISGQQVVPTT